MEWDTMAEVEDKRIRRTKKLLRQALTRLMQQKDFQSITVTDVVREADINRGTFYAHYRDVYDLRDKIETGMIEDFRGMIAAIRPSETVTLKLVLSRLMDYLEEKNATFVTNAVVHAQKLAEMGMKVLLVGGELKSSTEAIVGGQATEMIRRYHFTKGFFGTNGVTKKTGFTTPEASEAVVKEIAMAHCRDRYVLADHDKFGKVSSVTFGAFQSAIILTDRKVPGIEDAGNVIVV